MLLMSWKKYFFQSLFVSKKNPSEAFPRVDSSTRHFNAHVFRSVPGRMKEKVFNEIKQVASLSLQI